MATKSTKRNGSIGAKQLSPIDLCIKRFGDAGVSGRQLGLMLGKSASYVCQLTNKGGNLPNTHGMHLRWLELARIKKVRLKAEELIFGGKA